MTRLRNLLALAAGQLWIVPAAMSLGALAFAYVVLSSGSERADPRGTEAWWLYSGDASTARDLLSTLLSGMITMTSLIVSMTFVILTLAASQLGPRLISTFTRDRQIQAVLGLFIGTILYVLVILRSLDERLGPDGVPHVAVSIASALTVLCLFALLFYVHKIARSIISDTVVARVAGELHATVEALLPSDQPPPGEHPSASGTDLPPRAGTISLGRSGYVQTVDHEALLRLARDHDIVLVLPIRAGHFVLARGAHVEVLRGGGAARVEPALAEAIRSAFFVGPERSPAQDLEFSVRQLVETGLRALSPGVKDPFTAIAVIDQLGAALETILQRPPQPVLLRDESGAVRVVADRSDVPGLTDAAFDQLRQAAADDPAVLIHLADTLGKLAPVAPAGDRRRALLVHAERLDDTAREKVTVASDRAAVLGRVARARSALERGG